MLLKATRGQIVGTIDSGTYPDHISGFFEWTETNTADLTNCLHPLPLDQTSSNFFSKKDEQNRVKSFLPNEDNTVFVDDKRRNKWTN